MTSVFGPALVVGSALIALWIDTRYPGLAPESLTRRIVAAGCAYVALSAAPVFRGSEAAVYATVFAVLLPLLVAAFLVALWLLRTLRDVRLSH